jgi:uncharacterized protein (TIGR02118 family)
MNEQKKCAKNTGQSAELHSRREVLSSVGKTVTLGTVAAALGACVPAEAPREENLVGTRCVTVLYPNGDEIAFDFEYYKNSHLTLIMELYGKSIRKFELRKGLPGPDGSQPTYVATISIWIADLEAFVAAGEQHTQTLVDDVPNFTNGFPVFQTDEIYAIAES